MLASELNKQLDEERRVAYIGHSFHRSLTDKEVWRRIGKSSKRTGRTYQISNLGNGRTVSTQGLLWGGALKIRPMIKGWTEAQVDEYFPLEKERLCNK